MKHANVVPALILSASILGGAWLLSLNGRYLQAGDAMSSFDTRTGEVCIGMETQRLCFQVHGEPVE